MRKGEVQVCQAPCIVCGTYLRNFEPDGGNHPLGGLEFTTPGHYGSAVFDMEPGRLAVNICDPCIRGQSAGGRVLHFESPERRPERTVYSRWPASGTEAGTATDSEAGVAEGEGPVPEGETPNA